MIPFHVAYCTWHVTCCIRDFACCMLRVACCMLHTGLCMLHVSCLEQAVDTAGHLLLRLPSNLTGTSIADVTITGKSQTYAFAFKGCSRLTIQDINFHATTIFVHDSPNTTIERCNFAYPSSSKRSLGGSVAELVPETYFGVSHSTARLCMLSTCVRHVLGMCLGMC